MRVADNTFVWVGSENNKARHSTPRGWPFKVFSDLPVAVFQMRIVRSDEEETSKVGAGLGSGGLEGVAGADATASEDEVESRETMAGGIKIMLLIKSV